MSTPTDVPPPPPPPPPGPRVSRDEVRDLASIRRSRDDRKVAGVAAGLARHLDIDPLLVRVAFVVLTIFGGGGLVLYAVCWLFVPEEGTEDTVVRVDVGVRTAALIVGGVIAIASVIGDSFGGPGFPWPLLVAGVVLVAVLASKESLKPGGPTHPWLGGPPASSDDEPAAAGPGYPGYVPGPPAPPRAPRSPQKRGPLLFPFTFGLAALGLGVLGTLQLAGVDVPPSAYPAAVLGVCGLMLLVGAFYGRAGGLILIGLISAVLMAGVATVDDVTMGQTKVSPDTAADLEPRYDLGIGEIVIDLTKLDEDELAKLGDETLKVDLGVGHLRVIVPDEGLHVVADADIEVGEVILFGDRSDNDTKKTYGDDTDPTLTIDADLIFGQLEVITEKEAA